jgi:lysophospholipase L1-like esterase
MRRRMMNGAVKIAPGARLLFIGDSVTDCGRLRPVGRGSRFALGNGYVAQVSSWLEASQKARAIQIVNMGTSGNTVRDLARRWDADVLSHEPDWLSVMIGINDVWRQFDGVEPTAAVRLDEFWDIYSGLLARTRPRLKGLILMTPYYVQQDHGDPMRKMMDEYGLVVRDLASRNNALLVDTQGALDRVLARTDYKAIAPDRVHPTEMGHEILAYAFMRAVGVTPRQRR